MIGACSINQVTLMGRLTADPELRQTQSGVATCSFTVAVTRSFADKSGERQSDFISCVAWRQQAEFICRNFSKGRLILIDGDLRTRSYDDRNHPDVKHYVTEVFVT
ncbi:MAG: single-stranded DNA-binding protein [Oscillospiraceae bacterium]|nr:single-stranded DNA-binding protein [Oscillospiraceae bacterium]